MFRPGTDEQNVQMSDVLCDFCARPWSEDVPFIEGHRGTVICGNCLTVAYAAVVVTKTPTAPADFTCTLCREDADDRAALERRDESGWQSPAREAAVCARCLRQAAGALHKDPDFEWRKPVT